MSLGVEGLEFRALGFDFGFRVVFVKSASVSVASVCRVLKGVCGGSCCVQLLWWWFPACWLRKGSE